MASLKKLWESLSEVRERLGFGPVDLSEEVAFITQPKKSGFHDYPPQRRAIIKDSPYYFYHYTDEIHIGHDCRYESNMINDTKLTNVKDAVAKLSGITKCETLPTSKGSGISIGRAEVFTREDVIWKVMNIFEQYFDIDVWAYEKRKYLEGITWYEIIKRNR
jgi:hypothetical protein